MNLIKTKSFNLAVITAGDPDSAKLALVLPGRLDTKDYPHMKSHVAYLAQRGYFAVSFDPPGTWESGGNIEIYTMSNYLKAINELIQYYGNKDTFLVGHSRGGSMAVLAGMQNPLVTKFIAIMAACSYAPGKYNGNPDEDWKKVGYKVNKRDVPGKNNEFVEYRLPYSFLEDSSQYDMYDELKLCRKPKLFIYGEHDQLVLPHLAQEIFNASAEPKEIVSIDSDHNYREHNFLIEEVNHLIGNFLESYP